MKEEIKQLVNFYKEFGADAQKVLDFASNEINQRKMRNIFAQEETEGNSLAENNEAIPDGVYFIAGATEGEVNTKTYAKYDPSMTTAPFPTKRIGKQNIKAMTNILLSIIAMSLFARIVLQVRQGKRAVEKEKRTI